jgi:hypothetical protein
MGLVLGRSPVWFSTVCIRSSVSPFSQTLKIFLQKWMSSLDDTSWGRKYGKNRQNKQRREALKADKNANTQKGRMQVRTDQRTGSRISDPLYWSEVLLSDPEGNDMHRTVRNAGTVGDSVRQAKTCRYAVFRIINCIAAAIMWQPQTIPI